APRTRPQRVLVGGRRALGPAASRTDEDEGNERREFSQSTVHTHPIPSAREVSLADQNSQRAPTPGHTTIMNEPRSVLSLKLPRPFPCVPGVPVKNSGASLPVGQAGCESAASSITSAPALTSKFLPNRRPRRASGAT